MTVQAILFDFNGVIIDDEPLQLKAYQQVLKQHDIDLTADQYYALMGTDDKAFLRATFARVNRELTDEVMNQAITEKFDLHLAMIDEELPLFPGVETFIKSAARRYNLAVVSMARRPEIDYVLERSHLKASFEVVVSAEQVSNHKPDPEAFQSGFDQLNEFRRSKRQLPLLPDECLVIEDAAQGIQAARTVGMHTLGITNTISEEALRAAGAEVVTASLADWTVEAVELVFA